jgi:hypothetical protein
LEHIWAPSRTFQNSKFSNFLIFRYFWASFRK